MLIVGLGNPGLEYQNTRHNVGFWVVDAIAAEYGLAWQDVSKMSCVMASGFIGSKKIILLKPTTYMNLSGHSVSLVENYYKLGLADIVVIHDDLDIALGHIKYKIGGGSGGHNGLKSLDQNIGNMYHRIRMGIGKSDHMDAADYVLAQMPKAERTIMEEAIHIVVKQLLSIINGEFETFKHAIALEQKK